MSAMMVSESAKLAFHHATTINEMIAKFERGQYESGIQAFGADMRQLLVKTDLAEVDKSIMYDEIAPHEDNRDGELLILVGVWELLVKLSEKKWNDLETKLALACGVPPVPMGTAGKRKQSHCPRAPMACWRHTNPRVLTAVSAAGIHTTAMLRLLEWSAKAKVKSPGPDFRPVVRRRVPFSGKRSS